MPSTSPGEGSIVPTAFPQILPGSPNASLQTITSFHYRRKRYIAYISGRQLNLLSSPNGFVQALVFAEELLAIAPETRSGKLAVAGKSDVFVLEPVTEGWTKVWWEKGLLLQQEDHNEALCLSWGNDGEALVAGTRYLALYSALPPSRTGSPNIAPSDGEEVEKCRALWVKSVSSPIHTAAFSPTANLIATAGCRDRLVKIWRRLSFEEGLFDYTYLPHRGAVTHLEWRPMGEMTEERRGSGISNRHDEEPEVLCTTATDGLLRIWVTGSVHDIDILNLYTTVDLIYTIPASPSTPTNVAGVTSKSVRYVIFLSSNEFSDAVTAATREGLDVNLSHSLEHLKEVMSTYPDVIITMDGQGKMSAWGLHSIGHKRRADGIDPKQPFHIAHAEDLPLQFPAGANARFITWFDDDKLQLLSLVFGHHVTWWQSDVESFFSPSAPGCDRLNEISSWSGHFSDVVGLRSDDQHHALLSWDANGNLTTWKSNESSKMYRYKEVKTNESFHDAIIIGAGEYTVVLGSSPVRLTLRDSALKHIATMRCNFEINHQECSVFADKTTQGNKDCFRVVVLASSGSGQVLTLTHGDNSSSESFHFFLKDLDTDDSLTHSKAVLDPGYTSRFGVVSILKSGILMLHHVQQSPHDDRLESVLVASFNSGVTNASHFSVTNDLAAIVSQNRTRVVVVELKEGYVEFDRTSDVQIQHISLSAKTNLLAVGYSTLIEILARGCENSSDGSSCWVAVKTVSLPGMGMVMRDLSWMADGSIALAVGNGILLTGHEIPAAHLSEDIKKTFDVKIADSLSVSLIKISEQLTAPLPVWHPDFISSAFQAGNWTLTLSLLETFCAKLKFWSEGDDLDPCLGLPLQQLYEDRSSKADDDLDDIVVNDLFVLLGEKDVPRLTQEEQQYLKIVIKAIVYCSKHIKGLDNGALRYLFVWRMSLLKNGTASTEGNESNGTLHEEHDSTTEMHWREIAFAYHSTSQQALLDILVAHYDNKITWTIAGRLGITAWLNSEALHQIFESLAQSAYRATSPPDPINASLYFLALHKKPTLLALWRIATWHKEQRATMKFLQRDFAKTEHKTAAKKNAYALMGKRRFDYAAAFFLLADDPGSATSMLAAQCDDVMLAIAVARLYSGDGSSVLRSLIEDRLLAQAETEGDRWLMSWCQSVLGPQQQADGAAWALVRLLGGVRRAQQDDPSVLQLYLKLRKTASEGEWEAVLRSARLLRRMGLWTSALALVRNWPFLPPSQGSAAAASLPLRSPGPDHRMTNGANDHTEHSSTLLNDFAASPPPPPPAAAQPSSILDSFADPIPQPPAAETNEKALRQAKAAELLASMRAKKEGSTSLDSESGLTDQSGSKPEPTQFKEPDTNSLLDSFGF